MLINTDKKNRNILLHRHGFYRSQIFKSSKSDRTAEFYVKNNIKFVVAAFPRPNIADNKLENAINLNNKMSN